MKWFDLSFLEGLYNRIYISWYFWKNYPNPKDRKKARRELRKLAEEQLDDALRREAWAASYDNRPQRKLEEVAKELREQLHRNRS